MVEAKMICGWLLVVVLLLQWPVEAYPDGIHCNSCHAYAIHARRVCCYRGRAECCLVRVPPDYTYPSSHGRYPSNGGFPGSLYPGNGGSYYPGNGNDYPEFSGSSLSGAEGHFFPNRRPPYQGGSYGEGQFPHGPESSYGGVAGSYDYDSGHDSELILRKKPASASTNKPE